MSWRAAPSGADIKRILVLVCHYPSPYKPYYDTQLIDLLRAGYEVDIVAARPLDDTVHEKVLEHRLLERTRYYPEDAASLELSMLAAPVLRPWASIRFLNRLNGAGWRRKAGDLLRMSALPHESPDAIIVHTMGVALTFSWLRRWYPDVPMALYYHGGEVPSVARFDDRRVAEAFRAFDVVFTNTEFSRGQAIQRGCPPHKVRALPVGFELADYEPGPARGYRPDGILRLLCLGRMSAEKGLDDALSALKLVVETGRENVRLSLIGDGYLRAQLEEQVISAGLTDHVRFLGALTNAQVIGELANTDALILSSYAHGNCIETQACAVQEAMLMKALVVTTRTGGVPESIPEVMREFSVAERDVPALARAISAIYDKPESELARAADAGRSFVCARYDITSLNRRLLSELWDCSRPN